MWPILVAADVEKDDDSPLLSLLLRKLPQGRKADDASVFSPKSRCPWCVWAATWR